MVILDTNYEEIIIVKWVMRAAFMLRVAARHRFQGLKNTPVQNYTLVTKNYPKSIVEVVNLKHICLDKQRKEQLRPMYPKIVEIVKWSLQKPVASNTVRQRGNMLHMWKMQYYARECMSKGDSEQMHVNVELEGVKAHHMLCQGSKGIISRK